MNIQKHLTFEGLQEIINIRASMNLGLFDKNLSSLILNLLTDRSLILKIFQIYIGLLALLAEKDPT